MPTRSAHNHFQLTSPAFADSEIIPGRYTCKGENASPPLVIRGTPEGTISLAIIMHDPDSPHGDFLHWTIWNLDPGADGLNENSIPAAARQGTNDFGEIKYGGPCPHAGTHRYVFDLYALDAQLDVPNGALLSVLMEAIQHHLIAQTTLTGTYSAN